MQEPIALVLTVKVNMCVFFFFFLPKPIHCSILSTVSKALFIFWCCTTHRFLQHSDTVAFGLKGIGQAFEEVVPWDWTMLLWKWMFRIKGYCVLDLNARFLSGKEVFFSCTRRAYVCDIPSLLNPRTQVRSLSEAQV